MINIEKDIEALVREFVSKVVAITEDDLRRRAFAAVSNAVATTGGAAVAHTSSAPARVAPSGKRSLKLSAKGMAARKLQGQYLGMLRGLTGANRLRVKKVAREQGVAAAVKLGSSLK